MNKKIINLIVSAGSLFFALPVLGDSLPNPLGPTNDFPTLLTNIATQVGIIISSLGVVMIIISGILYVTSAGSPEKVGLAKKALIYAIAGIAIGVAASSIVTVVKNILGVTS